MMVYKLHLCICMIITTKSSPPEEASQLSVVLRGLVFLMEFSVGFLQSGDGYLVGLATRYSTELRTNYSDVLQQLEDLRLAEWSDHAPPPPLAPGTTSNHSNEPVNHIRPTTSYVNYPRNDNEPIYVPGSYLVSNQYYLRF